MTKLKNISKSLVNGVQSVYRRVTPPASPSLYPLQRPDYIFKQIVVEDIPVHTEDDFRLNITNKHPRKRNPNIMPVFLLPGLGETRFVLDQALGNSFVDYLALNGFDVYMGELRGHGKSSSPRERFDWNLDSFLRFDIPAMLHKVKEVSGSGQVLWVGHSMGGMLLYAYLIEAALHKDSELFEEDIIRGGITIGSPVSFDQMSLLLPALIYNYSILSKIPFIPTDSLGNLLASLRVVLDTPLTAHLWNFRNIEKRNKILYLQDGVDDIAQGVMTDFVKFVLNGDFQSSDGKINYRQNLYLIKNAILAIGGTGDLLASVDTVQTVFNEISSKDKEMRIFGRDGMMVGADGGMLEVNDHIDYGHVDLTLGRYSKEEVWPYMLRWLRKHAPVHTFSDIGVEPRAESREPRPAQPGTMAGDGTVKH